MSRFLKLTSMILNTNDIHQIIIHPNKYYIMTKSFSGFGMSFAGTGFNTISSNELHMEVCETKDPNDYKIVSDWINKID
jgi:hypothetical protein